MDHSPNFCTNAQVSQAVDYLYTNKVYFEVTERQNDHNALTLNKLFPYSIAKTTVIVFAWLLRWLLTGPTPPGD
jgi:hypothetical protein